MSMLGRLRDVIRSAIATAGSIGLTGLSVSLPAGAQPVPPDTLFGIRIGVPLEEQFGECPRDDKGAYGYGYHNGTTPCWKEARYGKEVALPAQVLKDTGA